MRKISLILILIMAAMTGCARVNPRINNKIDRQNGKIDEIKNNQNGIMTEVGRLKQEQSIQNSQLSDIQNGYLNLKNDMFNNKNDGIQILQGDGPIVAIFGLGVIGLLLWHYRSQAANHEQAAKILTKQIVYTDDPDLYDRVFQAISNTPVEAQVYKMITSCQKSIFKPSPGSCVPKP